MFLFWCVFFGGTIYSFYQKSDAVGMAATAAIAVACCGGFKLGALRIIASVIGFAAAVAVAPQLGIAQEHRFSEWLGTTGLANRLLSIGMVGLAMSLVTTAIVATITNRFVRNKPRLAISNCWLGFMIGGTEIAFAGLLLLGGVLIIEPLEKEHAHLRSPDDVRGRMVGNAITTVAMKTRASQLGPVIDTYNPFTRIPQLNKIAQVQQTVAVLSDPAKMEDLIQHPEIQKMQLQPEMKRAVDQLLADKKIKQILSAGKPLDRAAFMTLLQHPAILELVDQPGFLAEASRVIEHMDVFD